jgi:hypothetical protein
MLRWFHLSARQLLPLAIGGVVALALGVFQPTSTELTCNRQHDLRVQCGRLEHLLFSERAEVPAPSLWEAEVRVEYPKGDETITIVLRSANDDAFYLKVDDKEDAGEAVAAFTAMMESTDPDATWSVTQSGSRGGQLFVLLLGLLGLAVTVVVVVQAARRGKLGALLRGEEDWASDDDEASYEQARTRFAEELLQALQEAFPDEEAVYDPERFVITMGSSVHGLGNHFEMWSQVGRREKKEVIDNVVASAIESRHGVPERWDEVREHLLIRVRPASYNALVSLRAELETGEPWSARACRALNAKLTAELVFDGELIAASFPAEQLETWGVSEDEAWEVARRNLQRQTTDRLEQIAPGLFQSTWEDTYDAARMLLLEKVAWVKVKGDPVAFLPNRNLLLITGTEEHDALAAIAEQAEELFVAERSLSPYLFKLVEGGWDVWSDWQEDAERLEMMRPLQELQRKVEATDANEQKELLDALHERDGTDVFVASVMLGRRDGVVERIGSWADVESLLPEVEQLAVQLEDDEPLFVSWAQAQRYLGAFMTPVGLQPERWRVSGVPAAALGPLVEEVRQQEEQV